MIILKLRKLDKALNDANVDEDMYRRAILVLLKSMDADPKLQVQAEPTAKAIMASLECQYANAGSAKEDVTAADMSEIRGFRRLFCWFGLVGLAS